MKLGELIRKGRKAKDISKSQLSQIVGCTTRAIDYWESGERKISLENADKIFKALDMTVCIGKLRIH
jgi:transcriptional regulator with XRE-family HTH domain